MSTTFFKGFVCGFLVCSSILVAGSAHAVEELLVSHLQGGTQYWWEAEAFDERDSNTFVLKDEPNSSVPDLQGASGDQYVVHNAPNPPAVVEGKDFMKYILNLPEGGTYYVWARASWSRVPGGRDHNSFYVQVNGQPPIAQFARHVNTLGDANFPEDLPQDSPWAWIGDSGLPEALRGQPGGGLTNGLKMAFQAGENTFMVYHREGAIAPNTMCSDVFMISTVDFVPTDDDLAQASPLAVQPGGKLATLWGRLRTQH